MATGTFQKLKASEAPRRQRRSSLRMDAVPQWKTMRDYLTKQKPTPGEVWQMGLTAEDQKRYHIKSRRTAVRAVKNFLADHNLPYRLESFTLNGNYIVQVRCTTPRRKSR